DASAGPGPARMFAPDWYERADALAKQAGEALAAGRLVEAREGFRRARSNLPSPPLDLPANVARVFGDGRLRHVGGVQAVAFSPDGKLLAAGGGDKKVRVYEVDGGKLKHELKGQNLAINTVAFSPDGKWLASGSGDKSVRVWDAATGDVKMSANPFQGNL